MGFGFGGPGGGPAWPGRPGGPGGPGGRTRRSAGPPAVGGVELDPLVGLDDARKPLRSRLLAVPSLRARYLAHVRTIAEEWLDWKKLGPVVAQYRALIEKEVEADTRKLTSLAAFQKRRRLPARPRPGPGGRPGAWACGPSPISGANTCSISRTSRRRCLDRQRERMWRHVSNVPGLPGTLETCRHILSGSGLARWQIAASGYSASRRKNTAASGGSVRASEWGRP